MAGERQAAETARVEANAAETVAAVVEGAAAEVARAQETAREIAAAALAAPLAQDVAQLQRDAETWENEQEQLHESHAAQFREIRESLSSIYSRLTTLETPAPLPAIVLPLTDQSSILPSSENPPVETPIAEVTPALIVEPAAIPETAVVSENIPAARKPRTRFL